MTASRFAEPVAAPAALPVVGVEFALYFVCSAAALALDIGLYWLGLRLGLGYATAAAGGYLAGLLLAYALSVRYAFSVRRLANAKLEFLIFAAIGLLGLLLTEGLLRLLVGQLGLLPMPAKVATAGAVFMFNFGARKLALFSRREGQA